MSKLTRRTSRRSESWVSQLHHESFDGPTIEFLMFSLSGEKFALELRHVREIVAPPPLTYVPRAARHIMGICSVRGLLVSVLDLRFRLKLDQRATTRHSRILLAQVSEEETIGLFVDEVHQVIRLKSDEIESANTVLGVDAPDHFYGVARPMGEVLVLLNLEAIAR